MTRNTLMTHSVCVEPDQSIIGAIDIFLEIDGFCLSNIVISPEPFYPVFHMHDPALALGRAQVTLVGRH
jgi:hypothetical protein